MEVELAVIVEEDALHESDRSVHGAAAAEGNKQVDRRLESTFLFSTHIPTYSA